MVCQGAFAVYYASALCAAEVRRSLCVDTNTGILETKRPELSLAAGMREPLYKGFAIWSLKADNRRLLQKGYSSPVLIQVRRGQCSGDLNRCVPQLMSPTTKQSEWQSIILRRVRLADTVRLFLQVPCSR